MSSFSSGDVTFEKNVGVGTNSPSAKLDVVGDLEITGKQDITDSATGNTLFITKSAPGNIIRAENTVLGASTIISGIAQDTATTNYFYRNLASASTSSAVFGVTQDHAGDDQPALSIQNDGTGDGLLIDQNGNGKGINLITEATTERGLNVYNNEVFTGSNGLVGFKQNHASATGDVVQIVNNGLGKGLFIDQNGNGKALEIDSEATVNGAKIASAAETGYAVLKLEASSTGNGLFLDQNGNGISLHIDSEATNQHNIYLDSINTNRGVRFASTGAFTGTSEPAFFHVKLDNAASTKPVQAITNDGTGDGLFIDQNGDGIGLKIDSDAVTAGNYGLRVDTGSGANAVLFQTSNANYVELARMEATGLASNYFYRNLASGDTAAPVMFIEQDNSGDDQNALSIQQDGTGDDIDFGNSISMKSNSTCLIIEGATSTFNIC